MPPALLNIRGLEFRLTNAPSVVTRSRMDADAIHKLYFRESILRENKTDL